MIALLILFALFASTYNINNQVLALTSPNFIVGVRMGLAGLLILIFNKLRGVKIWPSLANIIPFLGVGFVYFYLANFCELYGIANSSPSKAAFTYNLSPFISATLSYLVFGEKINRSKLVGLGIGLLGAIPVMIFGAVRNPVGGAGHVAAKVLGTAALIVAAVSMTVGVVIIRWLVKRRNCDPLVVNGFGMLVAGLLGVTFSLFDLGLVAETIVNPVFWAYILTLTLVSNIICYNFHSFLLQRYTATFMALAWFLVPIFCALYSYLFYGVVPSISLLISSVIVFIGLWIFYREELSFQ